MVVIAVTALLAIGVALFVALPLLRDVPRHAAPQGEDDGLTETRLRLLADLYDLDATFHAGRVSHRDFARLRSEVETDLSEVLRQIDAREAAGEAAIRDQIAALRAVSPAAQGGPS